VAGSGEDARRRTIRWDDPSASVEAVGRLAGLPFLEAIRDGRVPNAPIAQLLGFTLTEVAAGRAVFECEPSESHYNPAGTVHGGVISTLLDSALSCAVHTTLPAGTGYTIVGSRLATAEARLTDAAGKLYAHAVGTCIVLTTR
jgi:acyl-coenzyme A thioesterase PaaI-like protein